MLHSHWQKSRMVGEDYKFVIVVHLAIEKPIKFNILKDTLASIWRLGRGMSVKETTPNLLYIVSILS